MTTNSHNRQSVPQNIVYRLGRCIWHIFMGTWCRILIHPGVNIQGFKLEPLCLAILVSVWMGGLVWDHFLLKRMEQRLNCRQRPYDTVSLYSMKLSTQSYDFYVLRSRPGGNIFDGLPVGWIEAMRRTLGPQRGKAHFRLPGSTQSGSCIKKKPEWPLSTICNFTFTIFK